MGYIEYVELLMGSPWLYAAALLIALPFYLLMLRRQITSVFDPLFLNMAFAAIGTATVIFLLLSGNIERKDFFQYSASEFCYIFFLTLIPLRLGKVVLNDRLLYSEPSRRLLQCIFLVASLVFFASQTFIYAYNGIPIFLESRLDYYAAGGGIGMFSRFIEVSSYFSWYLLLHKYTYKWKIRFLPRGFDAILLICLLLSSVLSGSKSGLLVPVFLIFYFRALHNKSSAYPLKVDRSLLRVQRVTIVTAAFVALLVIVATGFAADFVGSLGALLLRVVSAGDVYFMAYPGSNLHDLDGRHPFLALFGPTLAIFRVVDQSQLGVPLGFQLFRNITHSTSTLGPNPRHNIFGLVYFGYLGSLLYSSVLGILVSFVRNVLLKHVELGGLSELLYVFVALHVIDVNVDVQSFIGGMDSLMIVAPLIFFTAYILSAGSTLILSRESASGSAARG